MVRLTLMKIAKYNTIICLEGRKDTNISYNFDGLSFPIISSLIILQSTLELLFKTRLNHLKSLLEKEVS